MKSKKWKITISVLSIVSSILSTGLGYGFMGGSDITFTAQLICGFILQSTPIFVVLLLLLVWRKEK